MKTNELELMFKIENVGYFQKQVGKNIFRYKSDLDLNKLRFIPIYAPEWNEAFKIKCQELGDLKKPQELPPVEKPGIIEEVEEVPEIEEEPQEVPQPSGWRL
jgi:hypothetical protein